MPDLSQLSPTKVDRKPTQVAALVVSAAFIAVGIAGFIPGLTTSYDSLTFSGHHSHAMLLGVFAVSVLHNLIHLLFGVAGWMASRTIKGSQRYLMLGGIIYLALWLYGMVIDQASDANFVPINTADNWLHLGLSLIMIGLGSMGMILQSERTKKLDRSPRDRKDDVL